MRQARLQKVHSASGDNILHIDGVEPAIASTLHEVNLEGTPAAMSEISTTDIILFVTASWADPMPGRVIGGLISPGLSTLSTGAAAM